MKWLVIIFACLIAHVSVAEPTCAEECVHKGKWINSNNYGDNNLLLALDKLGRGVTNTAFGVVEIPKQTVKRAIDTGCSSNYISGFLVGIGYFVLRELAGIYEILTFPIPVPGHYAPVMDPLLGYRPKKVMQ